MAFGARSQPRVIATKLQKHARCVGCGNDAGCGVVWSLMVCSSCGERINAVAPADPITGLGYVIAVCAFVQGLRATPALRRAA